MQTTAGQTSHPSRKPRAGTESFSLSAIFEAAKILTGSLDPISDMTQVLNVLSSFMGLKHGALAILADPNDFPRPDAVNPYYIAATTQNARPQAPDCGAIPEIVATRVFRTGFPVMTHDIRAEFGDAALPPHASAPHMALVAVPVRDQTRSLLVLGVLCAYRVVDDGMVYNMDEDARVLTMIASLTEQCLRVTRRIARDRMRLMEEARVAVELAEERIAQTDGANIVPINGIVGNSPEISRVMAQVQKVARTSASVLLRGESGTGKELFARAIHSLSERKDKPFIKVNCAALSETLLESELFGHDKGAFTGAVGQKKGRFELADSGTLFLDEIGEIGPEFQAKLLRVLQEGEFERVGGTRTLKVNVRLVTATNRDLELAVAQGKFRADLYFRICVVPITLPPLRDRPSDIPHLAETFLARFNSENNLNLTLANDTVETLRNCNFPGNVRELENCISRVAAMASGPVIRASDMACQNDKCLSAELWRLQAGEDSSPIGGLSAGRIIQPIVVAPRSTAPAAPPRKTANTERDELIEAMEQAGWVQAKAARLLGMTPRQIAYALKKYDVAVQKF